MCSGAPRPRRIVCTGAMQKALVAELPNSVVDLDGDDSVVLLEKESSESDRLRFS